MDAHFVFDTLNCRLSDRQILDEPYEYIGWDPDRAGSLDIALPDTPDGETQIRCKEFDLAVRVSGHANVLQDGIRTAIADRPLDRRHASDKNLFWTSKLHGFIFPF
jgi:hypothetical protein